jgi:hypothetical protein
MITDVAVDPAGNWNSYFGGALWITVSIAGEAMLAKTAQTQQAMSISIMKKAADQQNRMADLLARNAQQAFPPAPDSGYGFSTYA